MEEINDTGRVNGYLFRLKESWFMYCFVGAINPFSVFFLSLD